MVYISDTTSSEVFSVEEYVDYVRRNVDVRDFESVVESASALRSLANNRKFVLDGYHDELKRCWAGASVNENSPQSIVIASERDYFVRTNIWLPVEERLADFEKSLYSYDLAHDHNFNFVTVGYFGEGYKTDLYTYDYNKVDGYEGEHVDLEAHGRHQLIPGRTMVYEAGRDVHVQRTPAEVSVSLNLMCRNARIEPTQQYIFDVEKSCISRGAGDLTSTRMFLLDLMRAMHDENTIDILQDVAASHRCDRTKAYALRVLRDIRPKDAEYFLTRATSRVAALSMLPLVQGSGSRDYSST